MPPDQAAAVVRRNTWQGMAQGRVPAAYPVPRVRLSRMLGGLKGTPPAIPEATVDYFTIDGNTVPAIVEGTSVVALMCSRGYPGFTTPAGWRVLDSGLTGADLDWGINWVLAVIDNADGTEGTTFTPTGSGHALSSLYVTGYVVTGRTTGTWEHITGPGYVGSVGVAGQFTAQAPSGSWENWWQMNAVAAVYTTDPHDPPPGLGPMSGRLLGSRNNVESDAFGSTPWSGTWYWSTIGAYGPSASQAFAVGWRP